MERERERGREREREAPSLDLLHQTLHCPLEAVSFVPLQFGIIQIRSACRNIRQCPAQIAWQRHHSFLRGSFVSFTPSPTAWRRHGGGKAKIRG